MHLLPVQDQADAGVPARQQPARHIGPRPAVVKNDLGVALSGRAGVEQNDRDAQVLAPKVIALAAAALAHGRVDDQPGRARRDHLAGRRALLRHAVTRPGHQNAAVASVGGAVDPLERGLRQLGLGQRRDEPDSQARRSHCRRAGRGGGRQGERPAPCFLHQQPLGGQGRDGLAECRAADPVLRLQRVQRRQPRAPVRPAHGLQFFPEPFLDLQVEWRVFHR